MQSGLVVHRPQRLNMDFDKFNSPSSAPGSCRSPSSTKQRARRAGCLSTGTDPSPQSSATCCRAGCLRKDFSSPSSATCSCRSSVSTLARESDGDQIDLSSDGEDPPIQVVVNVGISAGTVIEGAYNRKQKPWVPLMSLSQSPEHVRKAICDGNGLTIWIRGLRFAWPLGLQRQVQPVRSFFDAPRFVDEEKHFLNAILNVLNLFFSSNGIGLDCAAIVHNGVECTENQILVGGQYSFSVQLPTTKGSITCDCICTLEEGEYHPEFDCKLEVTCKVIGPLSLRLAEIKYVLNGDVADRSGLFHVGYFSLLHCFEELLFRRGACGEAPCVESTATFRSVTDDNGSPFEIQAFTECITQVCSILNVRADEQSFLKEIDGNTFRVAFKLEDHENHIVVEFKSDRVKSHQERAYHGNRIKQRPSYPGRSQSLSFPHNTIAFDGQLSVHCKDGLQHVRPPFPVDDASGRTAYLQNYLKARGCVCNEMTVKALLDLCSTRPVAGGPDQVQLILREDVWGDLVMFLQQNKTRLMDTLEDFFRTASLLACAKPCSVEIAHTSFKWTEYPHFGHEDGLTFFSENSPHEFYCRINLDSAGNIVLHLSRHKHKILLCIGRPLGGIRLAHGALIQPTNADSEEEADDENGDDHEDPSSDDADSDEDEDAVLVHACTFILLLAIS